MAEGDAAASIAPKGDAKSADFGQGADFQDDKKKTLADLGATKTAEFSSRAPKVQDDPTDFYSDCYIGNVKKLVKHCKDNEYKFKPDSESKKLSIELHDNMDGISFGDAMSTLKKIKDESQFCKVSNGYKYDQYESGDLGQWIEDEVSLDPRIVWGILKKFSAKFGIWDLCDTKEHS